MTATPQERLREIVTKGQELAAQGTRSADESKQLEIYLTEARELRGQIEQNNAFAEQAEWANGSAGVLPMASRSAEVENFTPAGETTLEHRASGVTTLSEQYGEGILDPKLRAVTGTGKFKKAFHQYLRAQVTNDSPAFRTLAEASDTGGGLIAA